jgi:HD-GYP domain-containing protein (c-di-GMP phosphodiesterase class II)
VTVADAFDAITTNRPYRVGRSFKEGLQELERWAGIQFDSEAVVAFRHMIEHDFPGGALAC